MVLWELIGITGGTYTAGTDWTAQFDDETASGYIRSWLLSAAGEMRCGQATSGRRARIAVEVPEPITVTFTIEITSGGATGVQLRVDRTLVGEYTAATKATFDLDAGVSLIELTWEKGEVLFEAAFVSALADNQYGYAVQFPLSGSGGKDLLTGIATPMGAGGISLPSTHT